MAIYNSKSMKARDSSTMKREILDTLDYAQKNRHNAVLIDEIIEKARKRKGTFPSRGFCFTGMRSGRKNQEIYALAEQIKRTFMATDCDVRAALFVYYCVNGCVYCPYHAKNKHIQGRS